MANDEMPVRCQILDGMLVIELGPNVLRFITEQHPVLQDDQMIIVNDYIQWMKSVKMALNNEEEDGSTMVTKMLDSAILFAMEHGYEGIEQEDTP